MWRDVPGRICGETILSRGWNAIGQKVSRYFVLLHPLWSLPLPSSQGTSTLKVSKDFLWSAIRFSESICLVEELTLLAHRVNASILFTDPDYYEKLKIFCQKHLESQPAIKLIAEADPLLPENRALLYNTRLDMHNDSKDPKGSLSVFTVFGKFEGGQIHYGDLGIKA
jgi:hypothetical protein